EEKAAPIVKEEFGRRGIELGEEDVESLMEALSGAVGESLEDVSTQLDEGRLVIGESLERLERRMHAAVESWAEKAGVEMEELSAAMESIVQRLSEEVRGGAIDMDEASKAAHEAMREALDALRDFGGAFRAEPPKAPEPPRAPEPKERKPLDPGRSA
ncbi:MAG: hypothetical protein VYC34_01380, partial [Planctomycetota bacterium]|nr:hypothetical protein [Planctomycetota bacterium]